MTITKSFTKFIAGAAIIFSLASCQVLIPPVVPQIPPAPASLIPVEIPNGVSQPYGDGCVAVSAGAAQALLTSAVWPLLPDTLVWSGPDGIVGYSRTASGSEVYGPTIACLTV